MKRCVSELVQKVGASTADQTVLRWFGHVERMDEHHMARRVLVADVSGGRVRGKPRLDRTNGVKMAFGSRGRWWRQRKR